MPWLADTAPYPEGRAEAGAEGRVSGAGFVRTAPKGAKAVGVRGSAMVVRGRGIGIVWTSILTGVSRIQALFVYFQFQDVRSSFRFLEDYC